MLEFREINEENFMAMLAMKQPPEQDFVAPNVYSLAEAWLYRHTKNIFPFALYKGDTPVGFMMLDADFDKRMLDLWRFMIAVPEQGKGYGQTALRKLVSLARESGKFDYITLSYVPGNDAGEHVYEKCGFTHTGEIDDGEVVMRLDFLPDQQKPETRPNSG